jgi:hypothetical protein
MTFQRYLLTSVATLLVLASAVLADDCARLGTVKTRNYRFDFSGPETSVAWIAQSAHFRHFERMDSSTLTLRRNGHATDCADEIHACAGRTLRSLKHVRKLRQKPDLQPLDREALTCAETRIRKFFVALAKARRESRAPASMAPLGSILSHSGTLFSETF